MAKAIFLKENGPENLPHSNGYNTKSIKQGYWKGLINKMKNKKLHLGVVGKPPVFLYIYRIQFHKEGTLKMVSIPEDKDNTF